MPSPALLLFLLALAVFLGFLSFELPGTASRLVRIVATILAGVVLVLTLIPLLA